jgi:dTDP-4-dehydrorhamnose reductase
MAWVIAADSWSAVINAAAYTDVDRAESEEALAFAVNGEAPSRLAAETARHRIPLIHISTDYVFDGRKGSPYVEQDEAEPLNAYGRSKLAGERGVCAGNPQHVILCTSWIYSQYLTIVADQRGCPTAACDVAKACLDIAMHCASQPSQARYGIFHYAGADDASWFELGKAIVQTAAHSLASVPQIVPIPTADYPTPAVRPADTRLDCSRIIREYGLTLRPWHQSLEETINCLLSHRGTP